MVGKKLYVGNLTYRVSSSDLEQLFSQFGSVESAEVISDRDTGRSKGFGFVEMSNDNEARAAIDALNDQEHDGRRLTVNEARPREPRAGGGGGGGGWRGGAGGGGGGPVEEAAAVAEAAVEVAGLRQPSLLSSHLSFRTPIKPRLSSPRALDLGSITVGCPESPVGLQFGTVIAVCAPSRSLTLRRFAWRSARPRFSRRP